MQFLSRSLPCLFAILSITGMMAASKSSDSLANVQCPRPDPDHFINQKTRLDGVADDIHYLIASELIKSSPSAVLALGQSSKTLRQATLPFIYRDLVLTRGSSKSRKQEAYEALIETFRHDGNCQVAQHVRSIAVKDNLPEEDLMLIFNKTSEYGTLRKLSWETAAHMPDSVLEKLQMTWPDLELSVCVLDRQNAPIVAHRQMDSKLLSSPLLKSLTYDIYYQGHRADDAARSEWPKLTQALVASGHVRTLKIQTQPDGTPYRGNRVLDDSEPKKLMRLDITSGMRLPALEELTILDQRYWGGPTYLWDTEHCLMLRDAMDLSRLRKLDFGNDRPDSFFSAFTGMLPKLKALRFGASDSSIGVAKRFVESLESLESLDIDRAQVAIDELWPTIMKHKETLRELILRPTTAGYCSPQYLELELLKTISNQFPLVERLGWDAPCKANVDIKHLAIMQTMNLRKLDLFLHLPFEASDYSEQLRQDAMGTIRPPPLDKGKSKTAAIEILETISQAQGWPLEKLTLHFARTGLEDRAQPYMMHTKMQVRRSKDQKDDNVLDDKEYEFRGRGEWFGAAGLEEELLLEED